MAGRTRRGPTDRRGRIDRREFLGWSAFTTVALALGAASPRRRAAPDRAAAALSGPPRFDTLVAAALALQLPIREPDRYRRFLAWRAERVAGHRDLYLALGTSLDGAARRRAGRAFLELDAPARAATLRAVVLDPLLGPSPDAITADQARGFRQLFVDEVLELFARTDAFVVLGYATWPGVAAGPAPSGR